MTKKYKIHFGYAPDVVTDKVLFEDQDSIVVQFTRDGETYSHGFTKDILSEKTKTLSITDGLDDDVYLEEIVSRAVAPENRIDFTKPIEIVYNDNPSLAFECEFIGALHEESNNFMSWFVIRDYSSTSKSGECNSLILVRGDGKTDVPGAVVRNVAEVKPKLVLPLEVGKKYKLGNGKVGEAYDVGGNADRYFGNDDPERFVGIIGNYYVKATGVHWVGCLEL